jgi:hypothetical protein
MLTKVFNDFSEEFEVELAKLGVDLREADNPESSLTLRRLWVLYRAIPTRSLISLAAADSQPDEARWGESEHLLANIFDAIRSLEYTFIRANTKKGHGPGKPPPPHPRPGVRKKRRLADRFPGKTVYVGPPAH